MSKELNCMNCSIGDFKNKLCDCNNGFCKEFKSIGRQEDFFNAVMQRIRPQGEWKLDLNGMDWNIPAWRCSKCGFVASYIGVQTDGLGSNPMNWAGRNYCPNCGAKMKGADDVF